MAVLPAPGDGIVSGANVTFRPAGTLTADSATGALNPLAVHPGGLVHHAVQLLCTNWLFGRLLALRRAGASKRRKLLRHHLWARDQRQLQFPGHSGLWHGFQNHRRAPKTLTLCGKCTVKALIAAYRDAAR